MKSGRFIGVMSGTSLDGVDVVLAAINENLVAQQASLTYPIPIAIKEDILAICQGQPLTLSQLGRLDTRLGRLFADAVLALMAQEKLKAADIIAIGCHGQTVWHEPAGDAPHTLQIGDNNQIAAHTGVTVVGDFRRRDMALGGQGAPLVPFTEYLLYRREDKTILLQNIGGIGNMTVLPAAARPEDIFAFDTGPGNMIIDAVTAAVTDGRQTYDAGGAIAARGRTNKALLARLRENGYYALPLPKTTGRELYGPVYVDRLMEKAGTLNVAPTDLLHTVTRFTAETIAYGLRRFSPQMPQRLIVGGGGSLNRCLMEQLRQVLPECRVMTNEDLGLNGSAKEAVAFAVLANETIFASCNNAPSATGARHPVVMGKISL